MEDSGSSTPDFVGRCFGETAWTSLCPELTAFSLIPHFFFWLTIPCNILTLRNRRDRLGQMSQWAYARVILVLLIIFNELIRIIDKGFDDRLDYLIVGRTSISIVTFIVTIFCYAYAIHIGRRSNGFVISFYFLMFVVEISIFLAFVIDGHVTEVPSYIWAKIGLIVVLNVILIKNDVVLVDKEELSPIQNASFYGRVFLSWMTPLISLGYKRDLVLTDMLPMAREDTSEELMKQWNEQWGKRMNEYTEQSSKPRDSPPPTPSIVKCLFSMYKSSLLSVTGLRLIADIIQFFNPVLLKLLIDFVSDSDAPMSFGVFCAVLMFFNSEIRSLLNNSYIYTMLVSSAKMQGILSNAVFQKTLRLSTTARNKRSAGEVVTYMAVDIEKITQFVIFTDEIFSCPFQIVLAMIFLTFVLGFSAIPGMILMILFVPMNYYSSQYIKRFQIKQMKVKDERTKMCNEILNGIKLIKLYAWEEAFEKKINELRAEEVRILRRMNMMSRFVETINCAAPFIVAAVSFVCFILSSDNHVLTPQVAFVSIAIFNQIRLPMRLIAMTINFWVQAAVSLRRLERFFIDEEMEEADVDKADRGLAVQIESGTFNWKGPEDVPDLKSIEMAVKQGELVALVGAVGSGKSSVLSAILGEMFTMNGSVRRTGQIAFVPQQAWLQNTTLRKNITFGKKYDEKLYRRVIDAAELTSDFKQFEFGDMTEVGENGVTLSGGQKARIGIARALYQEADIYLLDDCLSAVDAHVGAAVYTNAFGDEGFLRGRTRILVTHGLQYTKAAECIFVMKDGMIAEMGNYKTLVEHDGLFAEMIREKEGEKKNDDEEDEYDDSEDVEMEPEVTKRVKRISSSIHKAESVIQKQDEENDGKIIKNEKMETGKVGLHVYWMYILAGTIFWTSSFLGMYFVHVVLTSWRSVWLSNWSNDNMANGRGDDTIWRLVVYTAIGIMEVVCLFVSQFALVMLCQSASLGLHSPLLHSILRSPMAFFDTTPIGRILNRMSRDLEVIDSLIPVNLGAVVNCLMQVSLVLFLICYSTPVFLVVLIPLAIIYIYTMNYFISAARQLKRLESVKRSPILSMFGESIHGVASIRAYHKVDSTCEIFSRHVDGFVTCRWMTFGSFRWLGVRLLYNLYVTDSVKMVLDLVAFRNISLLSSINLVTGLELLGNCVVAIAAFLGVLTSRYTSLSPGIIGMSLSYALTVTEQLYFAVRMLTELETNIVAVERIDEYTHLEEEKPWRSPNPPPKEWPSKGAIKWNRFSTRYRSELPLVISNLTASTRSGEKVAVVGRTGSGKSSLTLALYRIIEADEGVISIDGVDISSIGLHELRSKITIIPQEPVLFSGTLRFNLDPFDQYSDDELWRALEACQLLDFVSEQPGKLVYEIAEGGRNMSVGQRQLVCLGRALLRKGRVLILDEATAACDVQTDALVQEVIRTQFTDSTVIAIAHRMNTIADYDRILVLDHGQLVEFDTPQFLLSDPNSQYAQMVAKSKKHD